MNSNSRKDLLSHLFTGIENLRYVLFCDQNDSLHQISKKPIELLGDKKLIKVLISRFRSYEGLKKLVVQEKGAITHLMANFENGDLFFMNILTRIMHRDIQFMDSKELLARRVKNASGIFCCAPELQLEFEVLRNLLQGRPIEVFNFFMEKEIRNRVLFYFNEKYGTRVDSLEGFRNYSFSMHLRVLHVITQREENKYFQRIINRINYFQDQFYDLIHKEKAELVMA